MSDTIDSKGVLLVQYQNWNPLV